MKWHTVTVVPTLPEKLKPLQGLARNLWYTWNPNVIELWRRLDRDLWEESHHNPVRMLSSMSQQQLEEAGMIFSGKAPNLPIMQILELPDHPSFFGTQAHPCLTSRPLAPQPMFLGLVAAAMKKRYPKENLPERKDAVRKA